MPLDSPDLNIRRATLEDLNSITTLFRETILHINSKDYRPEQVQTWAAGAENLPKWQDRIRYQHFLLAERGDKLRGFASVTSDAYLDTLYVHKDHQKEGVGTSLLQEVIKYAKERGRSEIYTDASLTARPFLEKHGFRTTRPQQKVRDGIVFVNYAMVYSIK